MIHLIVFVAKATQEFTAISLSMMQLCMFGHHATVGLMNHSIHVPFYPFKVSKVFKPFNSILAQL